MTKYWKDAMFWIAVLGVVGTFWQVRQNYWDAPRAAHGHTTNVNNVGNPPAPSNSAIINGSRIQGDVRQAPGGRIDKETSGDTSAPFENLGTNRAEVNNSEVQGDVIQTPGGSQEIAR